MTRNMQRLMIRMSRQDKSALLARTLGNEDMTSIRALVKRGFAEPGTKEDYVLTGDGEYYLSMRED